MPLNLTLKGLHSGFGKNADLKKTRILHCDIEEDKNFEILVKIGHTIIEAFLEKGVVAKKDLSHIRYDKIKGMWIPE